MLMGSEGKPRAEAARAQKKVHVKSYILGTCFEEVNIRQLESCEDEKIEIALMER